MVLCSRTVHINGYNLNNLSKIELSVQKKKRQNPIRIAPCPISFIISNDFDKSLHKGDTVFIWFSTLGHLPKSEVLRGALNRGGELI